MKITATSHYSELAKLKEGDGMPMANGWKTREEICKDYGIGKDTFYDWRADCLSYRQYTDAIITVGRKTYIDENRWQAYLKHRSQEQLEKMIDQHLKGVI